MADFIRRNTVTTHFQTFLLCLLLVHGHDVCASPVAHDVLGANLAAHYWKRVTPIVVTSDTGTNTAVINPATSQVIGQGPATDGGGIDLSLLAIIWIAFVFTIGIPLALAGIRLWRVTTGMAIGLAFTICVWAAFVNTVSANGISDVALTVIAMGSFAIGFIFGMLDFGRMIGILLLGVLGGFSIGVRVVLLRPGLLIPTYIVNWLVLAIFMIIGLFSVLFKQRFGLVSSCAAIGTFLVGLGIDLLIERQAGISFGLRFLFDRNNSHFLAIVHKGYNPPLMTQVILGVSIGVTPVLAFAQHKLFKNPFRPKSSQKDAESASLMEAEPAPDSPHMMEKPPSAPPRTSRMALLKSRFSAM